MTVALQALPVELTVQTAPSVRAKTPVGPRFTTPVIFPCPEPPRKKEVKTLAVHLRPLPIRARDQSARAFQLVLIPVAAFADRRIDFLVGDLPERPAAGGGLLEDALAL